MDGMTMQVNGEYGETEITAFSEDPQLVRVGVWIGRDEDAGPIIRQVMLDAEDGSFELLLSIAEATAIRDLLTEGIGLAITGEEPPRRTKAGL